MASHAFITFGSFAPVAIEVKQQQNVTKSLPSVQSLVKSTRAVEAEYKAQHDRVFLDLERKLASKFTARQDLMVRRVGRTRWAYCKPSKHQMRLANRQLVKEREEREFLAGSPMIVDRISTEDETVDRGEHPGQEYRESYKRKPHVCKSRKVAMVVKPIKMSKTAVGGLIKSIGKIAAMKKMDVEVIGRRNKPAKAKFTERWGCVTMKFLTKHEKGKVCRKDLNISEVQRELFTTLFSGAHCRLKADTKLFAPGDSGYSMLTKTKDGKKDLFVIRGSINDKIVNACYPLKREDAIRCVHYSTSQKYVDKYFDTFVRYRPLSVDHTCEATIPVEECGVVAGIVTQALYPMGKLTCGKCLQMQDESTNGTFQQQLERIRWAIDKLTVEHPAFEGPIKLLKAMTRTFTGLNVNFDTFKKIHMISGNRTESPFSHVNSLNMCLAKGPMMEQSDLQQAGNHLLEIARYFKNRTENIKVGDIKHFRNKLSAKAHINLTLMCDNQLDGNGDFVWGERSEYAQEIFDLFYEEVDRSRQYKQYINRQGPSGIRKTAINNLIVHKDFNELREQFKGERVKQYPITSACTSLLNSRFEYPCCCVTHEDGNPFESDLKMPTMNHLIIGNMGDPKLVGLPGSEQGVMRIAKPGYCYLEIFMAMLMNVPREKSELFVRTLVDILIPKLGQWPKMIDLATACLYLVVFVPATEGTELPRILVDHEYKTMHVVDSYGSLSTGYHVLKANTIGQLKRFASEEMESELKEYRVGGDMIGDRIGKVMKTLIRGVFRQEIMREILVEEPYTLVMSMLSPTIIMAMYNSGSLEFAIKTFVNEKQSLVQMANTLALLATKVSIADTVQMQIDILNKAAPVMLSTILEGSQVYPSYICAIQTLHMMIAQLETDTTLTDIGFRTLRTSSAELLEKTYVQQLEDSWQDLNCVGKLRAMRFAYKYSGKSVPRVRPTKRCDLNAKYDILPGYLFRRTCEKGQLAISNLVNRTRDRCYNILGKAVCSSVSLCKYICPDFMRFVNTMIAVTLLLGVAQQLTGLISSHRNAKQAQAELEAYRQWKSLKLLYSNLRHKLQELPTREEFQTYVQSVNPNLVDYCTSVTAEDEHCVQFQAKRDSEAHLERTIAFIALVLMMFDAERSDAVYRILTKLKSLVHTVEDGVVFQSMDDIRDDFDGRKLTVDFEIKDDSVVHMHPGEVTFQEWWDNQILNNNTIPHYRTEGTFMEFTRATSAVVALNIVKQESRDILLRGAVGSGKSTSLPAYLCKHGKVLLLEPTRPLTENVCNQLRHEPFYLSPTMRMKGASVFGSTPITVMTSGFAFAYFVNNPKSLLDYSFVIIDECHVHDSKAMAFRSMLKAFEFGGKVIKVSATPPGRECEFETQHNVKIVCDENLTHSGFVRGLGSGSSGDATQYGDNILVYVASYNEIDSLSKSLLERGFKVTKVDGRTMKLGAMSIETQGTPSKKHFVVATNIIENGVTLDIDVVVDFGTKVVPYLDQDSRLISYNKVSISYGERIQRCGRVGRHKPGTAIRIGHTVKGLSEIPQIVAVEAALDCFAYGLPVMTHNVSIGMLGGITTKQAKTMQKFELTPFFMCDLVSQKGEMHSAIHDLLKPYKLQESMISLNCKAIPYTCKGKWLSVNNYKNVGVRLECNEYMKIPFYTKDLPERMYEKLAEICDKFANDAGYGRITSRQARSVAYTLQTDMHALPRTLKILNELIASETVKGEQYRNVANASLSDTFWSPNTCLNMIRSHYSQDFTLENIKKLQSVYDQLIEFKNVTTDLTEPEELWRYGYVDVVQFESSEQICKHLGLRGIWNKSLMIRDLVVCGGVFIGGAWMLYEWFKRKMEEPVVFQAKGKRQRDKLRFKAARDRKMGMCVHGDDDTMAEHFGSAYTAKHKGRGTTKNMGKKSHPFVCMYGFNADDYSSVRYLDPLTGQTRDEQVHTDIGLIQEQFGSIRDQAILDDTLDKQQIMNKPGIKAYFMNQNTGRAIEVDLTPHLPTKVCDNAMSIAGFPEHDGDLRQTGDPKFMNVDEVPRPNEVEFEAKTMLRGLNDYNTISCNVCQLVSEWEDKSRTQYGIGYGSIIITNSHMFTRQVGRLTIKTRHGNFVVSDIRSLWKSQVRNCDILLVQMPKDFPPFNRHVHFRNPGRLDRVCLVSSNFQTKSTSTLISESSSTYCINTGSFWAHSISTKDGQCGNPLVSVADKCVVGIHSLANVRNSTNYFSALPIDFEEKYLKTSEQAEWTNNWQFNAGNISWGRLKLKESTPQGMFKTSKLVEDLNSQTVVMQALEHYVDQRWVLNNLHGNLEAVACSQAQLVTKHVVNGPCRLFRLYLNQHPSAQKYFQPLMGHYQKSILSRDAYLKDFLKYSEPVKVGTVDIVSFEEGLEYLKCKFAEWGFKKCEFVLDPDAIFQALNKNAAVGALYQGKKKDYFAAYTDEDKEQIIFESCLRLFSGKLGIWNGSLKAELRPKEKVEEGKTRSFTAAPIETLLGGKVCVDDFNNLFYSKHTQCPWSVGMTKFYGGWNEMLNKLPNGWLYCDADGSRFDSSLTPYLLNSVLRLRLEMIEDWPEGHQMLRNLYTEITYTPVLCPDGTIVKKRKGNNSGQPSTVVDNTIMVILSLIYALNKCGIKPEEHEQYCKYYVNGDDLIFAIHPSKEAVIDTFSESFSQLGLNYNFDNRTRNKNELWFMSHQAILVDGLWIPKIERERIVSILEWDRSDEPQHRLEAICAAMIEAWGYPDLVTQIRLFYKWVLEQSPYKEIDEVGLAPYKAETALKHLYTSAKIDQQEIDRYLETLFNHGDDEQFETYDVYFQSGTTDAGETSKKIAQETTSSTRPVTPIARNTPDDEERVPSGPSDKKAPLIVPDRDVTGNQTEEEANKGRMVDTTGQSFSLPRVRTLASKRYMPLIGGKPAVNIQHLVQYKPDSRRILNTIASDENFTYWFQRVAEAYEVSEEQMKLLLNGLIVWCIDNGTSPDLQGNWTMLDGNEPVTYPLAPVLGFARPTFRQIMRSCSDLAEAYIQARMATEAYATKYSIDRNLRYKDCMNVAFDFYVPNARTTDREREAYMQMKAAAVSGSTRRMFGLDGNVGTKEENTERHTASDVNSSMHTLMGVRGSGY